jgi:hypothetical protein
MISVSQPINLNNFKNGLHILLVFWLRYVLGDKAVIKFYQEYINNLIYII